jgi:Zn-dependent peptidase ImmA (M78 family)/transcriptional regulator with XRE-family HTH domain
MEFRPERLILARERRGLTKTDLADRLKISARTLINYETGFSAPDDELIGKLARTLNFPSQFFFGAEVEIPDFESTASFRSLTGVAAKLRNQAFAAGTIATELHDWIAAQFDLPFMDIPNLAGMNPEDAAVAVRQAWGLGIKPIPNMVHLLESKGIRVFSLPADHSSEIDAYCMWFRKVPFVFLNTQTTVERSRFDCGHELAHLVLDRVSEKRSPHAETRAHRFSSAFLMPYDDLILHRPAMVTIQSLLTLKKRYGVSITALTVRCHQVGFITDWQYRNLMIQLSRHRKSEPQPMLQRETSAIVTKVATAFGGSRTLISNLSRDLNITQVELSSMLFGLAAINTDAPTGSQDTGSSSRIAPALRLIR